MASWFVTMRYVPTAVQPTMVGHAITSPKPCARSGAVTAHKLCTVRRDPVP